MACGLRTGNTFATLRMSLNPSFSGIWPVAPQKTPITLPSPASLNPSFSGIWPVAFGGLAECQILFVLILLLVEYGLWL